MVDPLLVALGPQRLAGMFFVPGAPALPSWVEASPSSPSSASPASADDSPLIYRATVGPDRTAPLRAALLELIERAEEKVFLASFLFADRAVTDALARKAEQLRGGVYVLTALDRSFQVDLGELADEEPTREAQIATERRARHFENLRTLARAGAWLRSAGNLHAKLCVVDDRAALVTSANATEAAYEKNPENGLLVREPALARELGRVFARVFLHRVTQQSAPAAELDVKGFRPEVAPPWSPLIDGLPDATVATIGGDETSILRATLELIRGARRELCLTAWSAVGLRDHPVGLALREAIGRGVRVLAVFPPDDRDADRRETGGFLFADAKEGAVTVAGCPKTHAKALIADREHTLVWTGNLDGHHGYEDGFEVGVVSRRPEVAHAARAHVVALARAATHRGIIAPTQDALADIHGAPSPLSGDWTLIVPQSGPWSAAEMAALLRAGHVMFTQRDRELILRVGEAAELSMSVDAQKRVLRVERVIAHPSGRASAGGYLRGCRLRVTGGKSKEPMKSKRQDVKRRR